MPTLKIGLSKIYYEMHGHGFPIVLAHGIGGNHAIWYQQILTMSHHHRVIVFDHRGFGNSTDEEDFGRSGFVDDLHKLLNHLELEKVTLVGQSMGGGTAISFTCRYPSRVAALIVADSLHAIEEPPAVAAIMDEARRETNALSQLERVLGAEIRRHNPKAALLYSQISSFNKKNRGNLSGDYGDKYSSHDLIDTGVPILFIVGENDILFPPSAVKFFHGQVQGSSLVTIKNVGHSAFFEDPETFNAAVLSFIAQTTGLRVTPYAYHNT